MHGSAAAWTTVRSVMLALLSLTLRAAAVSVPRNSAGAARAQAFGELERAFTEYTAKHRREYVRGSPEYNERFALFRRSLAEVQARNSRPGRKWRAGVNKFADRSDEERRGVLGWRPIAGRHSEGGPAAEGGALVEEGAILREVAWTNLTVASHVYDQGACGSCWAVATVSLLDARHEIHYGPGREPFSVQELVSCVANPRHCGGKGQCKGATVELGMAYAMTHGLADANEVPYKAHDGECHHPTALISGDHHTHAGVLVGMAFGLKGYRTLPKNKEAPLLASLMNGPVAVSVAAHGWFPYDGGVFNDCPKDAIINHAVTLYGYKAGLEGYWLVRNSWGPDWGEKGYIRLARTEDEDGNCGVDNDPEKGVDCEGGPSKVRVCGACGILYDSVEPHFAPKSEVAAFVASGAHSARAVNVIRREDFGEQSE